MDSLQGSAEDEVEFVPIKADNVKKNSTEEGIKHHYEHVNNRIYDGDHHAHQKYSEEANNRTKRATTSARYQERNTCSLYIQTDPLIWRHIRESIPDVSCRGS